VITGHPLPFFSASRFSLVFLGIFQASCVPVDAIQGSPFHISSDFRFGTSPPHFECLGFPLETWHAKFNHPALALRVFLSPQLWMQVFL